jgi:hypothetical protein
MKIINAVIPARFPKMEAKRVAEIVSESSRVCGMIEQDFENNPPLASSVLQRAIKSVTGRKEYGVRNKDKSPHSQIENGQISLVHCSGRFGLCLSLKDSDIHIDVWHEENRRGAGRKVSKWPQGMSGRGKMTAIQVPSVIAADVEAIAVVLAWHDSRDERLKAIVELLK